MAFLNPDQTTFLGLPACSPRDADAVILQLPFGRSVLYGAGTREGPEAILDASVNLESFDRELGIEFEDARRIHNAAPLGAGGAPIKKYLDKISQTVRGYDGKFVLGIGGEHTVTWGLINGLDVAMKNLTVVQIDAHADLRDELDDEKWSHKSVMRRVLEEGCRIIQIGVRNLSRDEFNLASGEPRIETFYADQLSERWKNLIETLSTLKGSFYLTVDCHGLDPSVIPSVASPQPGGLSWPQTMYILRALSSNPAASWKGADLVEFVPSPDPPGCNITAAKLAFKLLSYLRL